MRARGPSSLPWACEYCRGDVPAGYSHKCIEYDKAHSSRSDDTDQLRAMNHAWRLQCEEMQEALGEAADYLDRYKLMPKAARDKIRRAASGMSAFGQDPQGLEAKPASPAPAGGDAQ